jgi:D-glycero-D-manno-heptose 1,7-bisphosphate phosphatase
VSTRHQLHGPGSPVRRALFVDRDGTLNPDLHYLKEASRLELRRGVGDALSLAHDHGYLVVCVTNQSGVERGFYTAEDVDQIHARLNVLLRPYRASVDAFYYCPHTPEHGCDCRKPRTGLFEQARRDWNIEYTSSAVVGDRSLDVEAGKSLGLLTALVPPVGHEEEVRAEMAGQSLTADIVADSFASAVGRILARG